MPAALSLLIELLGGGLDSAVVLSGSPGGTAMLAAIATASLFFALAVASQADLVLPGGGALHPSAVRRRSERTVFLPLCDPGAAGRPRPRAPSAHRRVA